MAFCRMTKIMVENYKLKGMKMHSVRNIRIVKGAQDTSNSFGFNK